VRRRAFLIVLALLVACADVAPSVEAAPATLVERVRAAIGAKAHRSFKYSVGVWDAATGDLLIAQNASEMRRTASAMKLATTGAALLALGGDHEMFVEIRSARPPVDGALRGNLIVEGTGDPGLSDHLTEGGAAAALAELARAVRGAGVRTVEGDLVLDSSAFTGPDRHPGWARKPDQYDWYMAPVTALTVNDACVDLKALPGANAGDTAKLTQAPPGAAAPLVNELRTTTDKKKNLLRLHAPADDGRIRVTGGVLRGSRGVAATVACVDPPRLLGDTLRHALSEAGVRISGETRVESRPAAAGERRVVLARHASALGDVIAVTNRRSQNLYAELILRNLGLNVGHDASFEGGCRAVRGVLELGDDFEQEDGSGLSRGNRATVGAIGSVLLRLYDSDHRIPFMSSLAKPGDPEGTLRRRLRETRFKDRVLAKTGTLRDTKALAGYVMTTGGRVIAFAILCEGVTSRSAKLQDAVVGALIDG
jgi:D-alanyl-D-alanine carboxypeptidase/D-alanyl-D-alanine-endopeptidase (penicillin-binding protein 4)